MLHLPDAPPHAVALAEGTPRGSAWLTSAERRCEALIPPSARGDWRAGRLALRRAARAVVTCDRAPRGCLRAAVAHRGGRALAVASAAAGGWGADLELAGTIPESRLRLFLTRRERRAGAFTPDEWWALKEAAWKAAGLARDDAFHALELELDGARVVAVRARGRRLDARATVARPWDGFVAAIVWIREAA